MNDFLYALCGVVLGGAISALISWGFARRSSKELRNEAAGLKRETEDVRHYINALISYLEASGSIRVSRDASGRPMEIKIIKVPFIPSKGEVFEPEKVERDEGGEI